MRLGSGILRSIIYYTSNIYFEVYTSIYIPWSVLPGVEEVWHHLAVQSAIINTADVRTYQNGPVQGYHDSESIMFTAVEKRKGGAAVAQTTGIIHR